MIFLMLAHIYQSQVRSRCKFLYNSEVFFAKYEDPQGPGDRSAEKFFIPRHIHCVPPPWSKNPGFSTLLTLPRFVARRCETKKRRKKPPGVDPTHFHEVAFFCFLIWNNIVSMIFVDFARKLCTKILGCRSTNFSEFSCACRYFFEESNSVMASTTLIKERNIKDTQNWKQAHDLANSTLPNLSPDLTLSIPPGSSNRCCRCRKSERLSECVAPSGCPC